MTKEASTERSLIYLMAGLIWFSLCLFGLYAGPDQKLVDRIYTATSLVVVVIAGFFLTMKWARITNFNIVIYVLVGLVLLMFTAAGGSGVVGAAVRWLNKPRPEGFIVVPVSVLVLSFGLTLFYIRLRLRFFYGFTEVLAGIAVAANKVVDEAKSLTTISASWSLAMLTAGVYLVVRGLDNMHQGISKDPLDKVALWLQQFVPTTHRFEARVMFGRFKETSGIEQKLVFRTFHRRRCISSQYQSSRVRRLPDGRMQKVIIAFHFVALEGGGMAFRLDLDDYNEALLIKGAKPWEPTPETGPIPNWVLLPFKCRSRWNEFFRRSVEHPITRTADEEEVR